MTSKRGLLFILMIAALLGLFAVQAFWISESIRTHNESLDNSLAQSSFRIKQEIEEDFYCFRLQKQTDIMQSDYLSITKSQPGKSMDTLKNFTIRNEDSVFIYPKNIFNYSIPVRVQLEMRFDYLIDSIRPDQLLDPEILEFANEYREGSIVDSVNGLRVSYENSLDRIIRSNLEPIALSSPIAYALFHRDSQRLVYKKGNLEGGSEILQVPLYDDELKFAQAYELRIYSKLPYVQVFISLGPFLLASVLIIIIGMVVMFYGLKTWQREKALSNFQKDMMHSVSHEMNTPISNMQLAVQSLYGQINDGEPISDRYLNIIDQENQILADNMAMLMDYAQIEEDKLVIKLAEIEVSGLLQRVLESFRQRVSESEGSLSFASPGREIWVKADETHFINICYNLLDNAVKYAEQAPQIRVNCNVVGKKAIIQFIDNCPPIEESQKEKIFEKFYRGSKQHSQIIKGYGLGLYYVRLMVRKFKGGLRIRDDEGRGNIFELELPTLRP